MNAAVRVACLAVLCVAAGCAFGRHYDYRQAFPLPKEHNLASVTVSVQDQRPFVKDDGSGGNFVGTIRSLAGIPYPVRTASGKPLAEDLTESFATSLTDVGLHTEPVMLSGERDSAAVRKVVSNPADRHLLFIVREWETDYYYRSTFSYDVSLSVYDPRGRALATEEMKGERDFGRVGVDDLTAASKTLVVGELMGRPTIRAAMSAEPYQFGGVGAAPEPSALPQ
jgi:hypothetical protein